MAQCQSVGLERGLHRGYPNTTLYPSGTAGFVNFHNGIEASQIKRERTVETSTHIRFQTPGHRGATTPRNDRDVSALSPFKHSLNISF